MCLLRLSLRLMTGLCLFALPAMAVDLFCTDFDNGTQQGWTPSVASHAILAPGASGLAGDSFLRLLDASGGPSRSLAPAGFLGNWSTLLNLSAGCTATLEFDYMLITDGCSTFDEVFPRLFIGTNSAPASGITAGFRASTAVSETSGSNPGWSHFSAPLHLISSGDALPSNASGAWTMSVPATDSDWNFLLANVQRLAFYLEVAQCVGREQFGIDNVCLVFNDPCTVSIEETVWGNIKSLYKVR